jgi:hypothetical protein
MREAFAHEAILDMEPAHASDVTQEEADHAGRLILS